MIELFMQPNFSLQTCWPAELWTLSSASPFTLLIGDTRSSCHSILWQIYHLNPSLQMALMAWSILVIMLLLNVIFEIRFRRTFNNAKVTIEPETRFNCHFCPNDHPLKMYFRDHIQQHHDIYILLIFSSWKFHKWHLTAI